MEEGVNDLHESVNYLIISWVLMEMIMLDMSGCTLLAWCEVGKEAKTSGELAFHTHYIMQLPDHKYCTRRN